MTLPILGEIIIVFTSIFTVMRQQLAEVIDKVFQIIRFLFEKFYDTAKFITEQFPYDNYQRTLILSIICMILITSLLALFGVGTLTQPIELSGFTGYRGNNFNPNAAQKSDDLTIGIGQDNLRERIDVAGIGIVPREEETPTTLKGQPTPQPSPNQVGDTDKDGIPDESDYDLDGDGTPNLQDPDIDGDGKDNTNDPNPCGEYIRCPEDTVNNGTQYITLCGNGICEETATDTKTIYTDIQQDDRILYYDIPYWCLKENNNLEWHTLDSIRYYGVVGSTYLKENLDNLCYLETLSHEIYYRETTSTCPQDCLDTQRNTTRYPEYCYNRVQDEYKAEEGTDCGGLCIPCHCVNGYKDENETGIDCGTDCISCSCTPTGANTQCGYQYGVEEQLGGLNVGYCCPEGTGICTNRCLQSHILDRLYSCCEFAIITGEYRCSLDRCYEACRTYEDCTKPQYEIINQEDSTINTNGAITWQ